MLLWVGHVTDGREKVRPEFWWRDLLKWPIPWPRGLRRGCAATRLLGLWVGIPPGACKLFPRECYCVLSDRGLCDDLITRPEESYRLWRLFVSDLEASRIRKPWFALGRSATGEKFTEMKIRKFIDNIKLFLIMYAVRIWKVTLYSEIMLKCIWRFYFRRKVEYVKGLLWQRKEKM
jgi:hypothetical protein